MSGGREVQIVVPTFMSTPADLEATLVTLESLARTIPDHARVFVVDDGSPTRALVDEISDAITRLYLRPRPGTGKRARDFFLTAKAENEGFSRTVNVGLRDALECERDAILVNADMEFTEAGWVERMQAQQRSDGEGPADVVGARLLFPNGLIQHGGIFFSLLGRMFDHRYKYAPHDLPEAMYADVCPVTGACQFIRWETLAKVGLYDEAFYLGFEDVDYCLRVFAAGGECVYQPLVWAFHFESMFRGRPSAKVVDWQRRSLIYFWQKYARTNFVRWVPPLAAEAWT